MTVFGGNIGAVDVPTGRSVDPPAPLYVARPGDITLNVSGWQCNRVQSYSYQISIGRTPLETMNDNWGTPGFIVEYPIPIDITFELDVDSYEAKRFFDFICTPLRQDLEITLNDCNNTCGLGSGIRTFKAPHARLITYNHAGSIETALRATLEYRAYVTSITGIKDLIT